MFHRKTLIRILQLTLGVALGLNLMTGAASAAPSSTPKENPSQEKYQCPEEENLNNVDGHGANNTGGYQSTCDEDDFGGNGQESGPGKQTGKPCAGCVGNADDKNPPGQYPDGSDANSGYECDGRDRPSKNQQGNGNHGIGDENPAHTGCDSEPVPPAPCPDGSPMPAGGAEECPTSVDEEPEQEPVFCPGTEVEMVDTDGNGVVNAADCNKVDDEDEVDEPDVPTCPQTGEPMTEDTDGNGVVNAADCNKVDDEDEVDEPEREPEVKVTEVSPDTITPVVEVPATPAAPAAPAVAVLAALDLPPAPAVAAPAAKARPTEVLGVQIERAPLARTGLSTNLLVLLAGALLFVGALLVRTGRRPSRG